uniref:Uncharacterized protein n=1 Tax=Oryza rufipogon TaxID=4529 RepID=A0A0E0R4J5_ORYRU
MDQAEGRYKTTNEAERPENALKSWFQKMAMSGSMRLQDDPVNDSVTVVKARGGGGIPRPVRCSGWVRAGGGDGGDPTRAPAPACLGEMEMEGEKCTV